jgi:hypothetical protein
MVATGVLAMQTVSPAQAQKISFAHTERYASQDMPITNWTVYDANHNPVGKDPNCTSFAGVYRWSKIWVDTYGIDEPIHSQFACSSTRRTARPSRSRSLRTRVRRSA